MSILQRYVLRELLGPLGMGLLVFTFVVLIARVFKLTDYLLNSSVPGSLAGELVLLLLPGILSITIPMAVLVAILLSIGRLAADREILAIRTTGVNLIHICIPILLLSAVLTGLMMWANHKLIPYLYQKSADIGMQLEFHVLSAIPAGVPMELPSKGKGGDTTFFYDQKTADGTGTMMGVMMHMELPAGDLQGASESDKTSETKNATPASVAGKSKKRAGGKGTKALATQNTQTGKIRQSKPLTKSEREKRKLQLREYAQMNEALVIAQTARIVPDIANRVLNFELTSGSIHFSNPDKPGSYDIVSFDSMTRGYVPSFARTEEGYYIKKMTEMSNRELLEARKESGRVRGGRFLMEFLQRFSIPMACIAFAFIAIPLAVYVRPTGKAIAFAMSFLLILLYYGLLEYGVALGKTGNPLGAFAIFLPNVLLMSAGSIMLYRMVMK